MVSASEEGPRIIQGRCNRCGACVLICECGVLSLGDSGLQASQVERCDGCARCEEICPEGALEVEFTIIWDNQSPAPPADAVPTAGGAS